MNEQINQLVQVMVTMMVMSMGIGMASPVMLPQRREIELIKLSDGRRVWLEGDRVTHDDAMEIIQQLARTFGS